ncbi:SDR family oxidoreductase [Haloplanus rallus]|uniref:SDR family oxidoreductase n=1 Tax=Haloplanus rallus TaxID=1816183 RepID=A0A6B9F8W5_9EURY|nr:MULTISPECIES: SDR family oxidoreductase [Haloplanus]QGX94661.1 SDR family oxidoreductase [Haloplanus rallus]
MQPKTVLITGCSSGIGRATAEAFLDADWEVYATARNPADVERLGDRGCTVATLDVTEDDDVDRVVDRILDDHGRIDCLVNNAGYAQFGPIEDVPVEAVHRQFDVNVYGAHRLTRAVLPHMRRRREGTVVNVSSVAGRLSFPGGGVYAGSKFALEAMTDALRAEVDEYGVDAVLIEPGPVDTDFTDRAEAEIEGVERSGAYEDFYDVFEDTQAIGGGGPGAVQPERVAEEVLNAASATKPASRVPVGTLARVSVLGRFVPDRLRDRAFSLLDRLA